MATKSVVLTGATGSLGAVILEQLLENGIPTMAILRSFQSTKAFFEEKYHEEVASGTLRFVEIPDMTVPQAFHTVAENASAIIHVATPLSKGDFVDTVIKPTELITENVLTAAAASSTVKRVIITGSLVSVFNPPRLFESSATFSEADFNDITVDVAIARVQTAYGYSKTVSELKAWEFMRERSRSFDLIFLLPPQIYGRSIQPGYKATKNELGGISAVYRELFDRDTLGTLFPFVM
jgi:nucleoside-diphosphate-sugar epimerase